MADSGTGSSGVFTCGYAYCKAHVSSQGQFCSSGCAKKAEFLDRMDARSAAKGIDMVSARNRAFATGECALEGCSSPHKSGDSFCSAAHSRQYQSQSRSESNGQPAVVPELNERLARVEGSKTVIVTRAAYLGGLPDSQKKKTGNLYFTDQGVGVGAFAPKVPLLRWDQIASISVDAEQIAKRKTGAIVMFGVLGGLGGKSAQDRAQLAVTRTDGAIAYFEIAKISEFQLKAKIAPIVSANGINFEGDEITPSQTPASPSSNDPMAGQLSVADELERLAALVDRGLLTREEFEAQKQKLLNGN
jgi:hypothetical protein